jgi:hypothetical protein
MKDLSRVCTLILALALIGIVKGANKPGATIEGGGTPSVKTPTILLVDDDGSAASVDYTDVQPYFADALTQAGYSFTVYEVTANTDGPPLDTLLQYDIVIWFTGETWNAQYFVTLTENDEANLAAYLDAGGNLFLSAHDYFWDRYPGYGSFSPGQFPYDYLHVNSTQQDLWTIVAPDSGEASGVAGSVAENMHFKLWDPYTPVRSGGKGPDDGLYIDLLNHSGTDLFEMVSPPPTGVAAMQYDAGTYKVVFTTISFAALVDSTPPSTKAQLMENIINWFTPPSLDWVDHDTGNVVFTVTNKGACGFTQTNQPSYGSGFIYPAMGMNHLYHGSVAVGNSEVYCVDSYYDTPHDWSPVEGLFPGSATPPSGVPGDQTYYAKYDDSAHPGPKGLSIIQDSWSWAYSNLVWDFVIIRYTVVNEGLELIENLYVGQFMDWDIGDYSANRGGIDDSRNLVYMWDNSNPVSKYVGVALLEPETPQNLALIDHDLHVYPYQDLPDSIMIHFLDGTYNDTANMRDYDWSMCVSAGPFTLAPGESVTVAFAIVGGDDLSDLQFNVDIADSAYWFGVNVEEGWKLSRSQILLRVEPNPVQDYATVVFEIPKGSRINLTIYDASGKVVRNLLNGYRDRGLWRIRWDGRDNSGKRIPSGVYFFKLEGDNFMTSSKMLLVR